MKYNRFILIFFLISAGTQSCEKLVRVDLPKNQITTGNVFKTEQSAIAVLSSVYYSLSTAVPGNMSSLLELYADELTTTSSDLSAVEFSQGYVSITNLGNANIWNNFYAIIYQCNAILKNIETSSDVTAAVRDQIEGEALFIRSLCYFYLVNLYNDVPLFTTTDVKITATHPRTPTSEVYSRIVSDLMLSKSLVSESYLGTGSTRANKFSVSALLARVYLYQQKWILAEKEASFVIEAGMYALVPSLSEVFIKDSRETILELWNKSGYTTVAPLFVPSPSSVPLYPVSENLLSSFEAGDERKNVWIDSIENQNGLFYFPYKYQNRTVPTGSREEYTVLLRLAEQYLIRAEARAKQNKLEDALLDLNTVRNRAGLSTLESESKEDILSAIEQERRVELFSEWGHRFFDLKRYGHLSVLASVKTAWKPASRYLPIPQHEILNNPRLIQNPGY